MTQFLARGLIAGALVMLVVTLVLTRLIEADTIAHTLAMVDDHAQTFTQMISGQMRQLIAGDSIPMRRDPTTALAQMVEQQSQDEQLLRVMVVDTQNQIVGAKDPARVGQVLTNEPAVQVALNGSRYNQLHDIPF